MENTLAALFSLNALSNQLAVGQILDRNEKTEQYGLSLTPDDASALMATRTQALNENGRIEVGDATIGKLIDAFCDSAWISQRDYTFVMHELLEIFYYTKNETLDLISDDELIAFMKERFEYHCGGSLELLKGKDLEKLASNLRFGVRNYKNVDEDEIAEEDGEDEEAEELADDQ